MMSFAVEPPSTVKLPGYVPNGALKGTVTSRIGAVTDWFAVRNKGVFKKNFVSSRVRGAVMFALSSLRNSAVAPVFINVAENVTVCPRLAFSNEDVNVNVNGPPKADVLNERTNTRRIVHRSDMFSLQSTI
jgi:hypothetical protein